MTMKASSFHFKPFSRKQRQVLNWWCPASPVKDYDGIIADGAIRSGKTMSMSLSYILWAMSDFDGQQFGMAGKTIKSFERNVYNPLKVMLNSRGIPFEEKRSDQCFIVRWNGHENKFFVFGGKDESSQSLVQGITLAGFFFDEVALMPESFVNQATGRCSVEGAKFWFNCNPDSPYHWFKQSWIDERERKRLIYLHFTMDDNLSLSERTKERYRNQYSGVFYQRFILGQWVMAEGVIYDMFDTQKHVVPAAEITPKLAKHSRYVSCDYGTQNATVFLLWEKGIDGVWYCTREYYYSGRDMSRQKTDSEYADDFQKWISGTSFRAMIVDPAAASFIAELRKRNIPVVSAKNDVLDGIRLVGSLLKREKIKYSDVCKNTIKEYGSYVWDEKAADRGIDAPVKQHDHAMDASRYFVMTVIGNYSARIKNKAAYGFD